MPKVIQGKPVDRRIQRTRETLRNAFLGLLLEQDWDAIRVQDICEKANVGRSTFYSHFVDKEGLLVGGMVELGEHIKARYGIAPERPVLWFARGIIDHACENQVLFRALLGKRSGEVVQKRFRQLAVDLARDCLKARGMSGIVLEATSRYLGAGFMELLCWWLEVQRKMGADEFEAMFQKMAASALESVAKV